MPANLPPDYFAVEEKFRTAESISAKIACLEEIAYRMGFIDEQQMQALADDLKDSMDYKKYLLKILAEVREFN